MMLQCDLTQLYSVGLTQVNTVIPFRLRLRNSHSSLCHYASLVPRLPPSFPSFAEKSLGMRLACFNITTVGIWITCRRLPEAGTLGVNKMYQLYICVDCILSVVNGRNNDQLTKCKSKLCIKQLAKLYIHQSIFASHIIVQKVCRKCGLVWSSISLYQM